MANDRGPGDETGSWVLDQLEPMEEFAREAVEK